MIVGSGSYVVDRNCYSNKIYHALTFDSEQSADKFRKDNDISFYYPQCIYAQYSM